MSHPKTDNEAFLAAAFAAWSDNDVRAEGALFHVSFVENGGADDLDAAKACWRELDRRKACS